MSNAYIKKHDQGIKGSLINANLGSLIVGIKDTVLANVSNTGRIASRSTDGTPVLKKIQPLSTWHWASYADYSHGIRLVDRNVLENGEYWILRTYWNLPN